MSEVYETKFLNTREVVGKQVITLEGEDLGTVSRLLVNPETRAVAGLILNAKGWFKGEKALEFSSISSIGGYAVTIQSKDTVNALNAFPLLQQLSNDFNIYNTRVITPTGELMGEIEDFTFDVQSGQLETFLLSGGLIKNLFKGKAEISKEYINKLGPDVIIAKDTAQENLVKADPGINDNFNSVRENLAGWKSNLDDMKDDVEKRWDVTLDTAKAVSGNLGEKIKGLSKNDLVNTYENWAQKLQTFKNRNTLSSEELSSLLWKKTGRDIYDNDGNLLLEKDGEVSPEVLEKVQVAKKTKELLLAVATRDVSDKLEVIERESEGL